MEARTHDRSKRLVCSFTILFVNGAGLTSE
jgi:hypothetical protein